MVDPLPPEDDVPVVEDNTPDDPDLPDAKADVVEDKI